MLLESIEHPSDLRGLSYEQLDELAAEIRDRIIRAVRTNGGHLGSNLGAVGLARRVPGGFGRPPEATLGDPGHRAYTHKMVTGRSADFPTLRQPGGLSGYPCRAESDHDWIENSHASTALCYAHGLS